VKHSSLRFIVAAMALISISARGQIIWSTPTEIENDGGESDVSAAGIPGDALQALPSGNNGITKPAETINGVLFNSDDQSLTDGAITYSGPLGGGSDGGQGLNIAPAYASVLAGCVYVDDNPADYSGSFPEGVITLDVTAGHEYQVQLWNAYPAANNRPTFFASGGSPVELTGGDFVLGDFLATSSTQVIDFYGTTAGTGSGVGEVNAVSLRDLGVPEPSAYAMMIAGLAVLGLGLRRVGRA
jgi:hypothetical protein